jgi:hypothetical protein
MATIACFTAAFTRALIENRAPPRRAVAMTSWQ